MTNLPKIMRGGTELRRILIEFMEEQIPLTVNIMRDHYNLDQYSLPSVRKYDAIDPTTVDNDEFPAMGCVVINDRGHVREDLDFRAQMEYSPVYTVRFVVIARTPFTDDDGGWEEEPKAAAIRVRDDLVRCLHHVLLNDPGLHVPDVVKFNEGPMASDYLEPFLAKTQSARWIAAALINAEVAFTETTWLAPIGDADTITVETDILDP